MLTMQFFQKTSFPQNQHQLLVEASAIPLAALTAWRALKSTARIIEGQRLLVIGGGGAVCFAAIQLAIAAGCHFTTTCGNRSINSVMAAGVDQAIDFTAEDIEAGIKGNAMGFCFIACHAEVLKNIS
ncbi:reticulon-4-interacting protein 1 homolog, mitochondrial-like isoform X2 [Durio zibethinus]|uniref:Reticulon-4-interacting protein 1 homolog, mitochondrial-like isoform X2 n=1 Tax=Durio zibethinus TaxID=66656 RepID=A0A6P5WSQ0_DURZI|nr:reticulon-4-interacting protein 1 homolog, mitochondrial-like isoform X2 [Durio zibethinus]